MNDIKITKSGLRPPKPTPAEPPDLATLHKEIERAHLRLDYVAGAVEDLLQGFDRQNAVLKMHREEIESLREMVATLWNKVMPGHQEFLRKIDGIFNSKKPDQD